VNETAQTSNQGSGEHGQQLLAICGIRSVGSRCTPPSAGTTDSPGTPHRLLSAPPWLGEGNANLLQLSREGK